LEGSTAVYTCTPCWRWWGWRRAGGIFVCLFGHWFGREAGIERFDGFTEKMRRATLLHALTEVLSEMVALHVLEV
jgi:hypothetical protein